MSQARRSGLALCFVLLSTSASAQQQGAPASEEAVVVYRGATLIDAARGGVRANTAIVVRGERIETIADADTYQAPKAAVFVDVGGRYVVPGFINTHVHLAAPPDRPYAMALLRRDIYGGVTAVRGMADDARSISDLSRATKAGEIPGPDIVYSAFFAGPSFFAEGDRGFDSPEIIPGQAPWSRQITAETNLSEAVTLARGSGASGIKVYANLDAAAVARIVAEAHRQGLPAWAHGAVFPASPLDLARAGADTMSHVCMLAFQAQPMPVTYHNRADVDESRFAQGMPAPLDELFDEMKKRGTILDATLYIYKTIERMRAELPDGVGPSIYCSSDLAGRIARAAHAAGVEFSVGTDAPTPRIDPIPAVQEEMELMVSQAGMSPLQVLRSATLIGARSLGLEAEMGTIEPGKLANMVFLAADPTQDISATRQVILTVKRGHQFARKDFVPISAKEFGEPTEVSPASAATQAPAPAPAAQSVTPAPTAPSTKSATPATPANDPPPDSEVFLASLDIPNRKVGTPKNITRREGYDNQPAFLNDGSALLYVASKGDATDIYRYDIATGLTTQVTRTEESEYSPTPLPDNRSFSVVRVAKPNAQGTDSTNPPVWRYGLDGQPGEKLIDVTAVGYHAWLDPGHIAVFVVGDEEKNQPHKLLLVDVKTGASTVLSEAPGRQLGRTPDRKRVSFVDKSESKHWRVVAKAASDDKPLFLVDTPKGPDDEKEEDRSEDYAWLPDGSLMMARGNTLLRWNGQPGTGLQPFATLKNLGGDIKRLAVSKDGKQLAFVVQLRKD